MSANEGWTRDTHEWSFHRSSLTDPRRTADRRWEVSGCSTPCYVVGMAQVITQRELRNDSGEIMRRLDQGETFIVTRNGTPVGELTPMRRHRFVSTDAVFAMFRNAPTVDADRFRADLDDIADQDAAPRG